ncbi:hypothetical protein AG1IA_02321 [Rhizoctonia solani AG-1 IA]|uniref:Uncharacterized protein n=1 Tax=Thanatephorus cucumeris (strain AG1-IA) TaxID=983506 RepID=L8X080_THACA|nr:hypothetical protein AG1IA_02321 [Rhizoctonia solani AG-1 IA]
MCKQLSQRSDFALCRRHALRTLQLPRYETYNGRTQTTIISADIDSVCELAHRTLFICGELLRLLFEATGQ